jgi:hypothetical protein
METSSVHAEPKLNEVISRGLVSISLLLVSTQLLFAQLQADVSCLQVDDGGNVTINWTPPNPGGSSFNHYEVLYGISPSMDFTSIANNLTPVGLNTFTHASNLALSNSYYYVVNAWYDDGAGGVFSVASDTLSTIYLEAEPALSSCNNCDGAALLQWNQPWLPAGMITDNYQFEIWTDYPGGNWQLLTTVAYNTTEYMHYVYNCSPILMNFRIRLITDDGCEFVSNISGDEFIDAVFPDTGPVIKIEINADNDGYMEWEHITTSDIVGYQIYRCVTTTSGQEATIEIGEVNEAPWTFTDMLANPGGPYTYKIAARDACNNKDTSLCRMASYLNVEPYQFCDSVIEIDWASYSGWENTPSYYIVYNGFASGNNIDYNLVSLIPVDTVTTLLFVDNELEYGGNNVYRIEAVDTITGYRAFTNFNHTFVNGYDPPEYLEIQSATVLNSDSVLITLGITPTADAFRYVLQRFDSLTNSWDDIVVQDLNVEMSWDFTDSDLATDVFSYSYRIVVFNACGLPVDTSNVATTILLDGEPNQERLVNTLRWSPYSQWNEGVKVYQIYRRTKTSEFELLTEINGGASLFYEDDVSELVESDGDFYYRIDAVEKTSDARDAFISKSNEVNVSIDPIIWIPNAMVLGGYNELFKPVMSFALVEEYYLVIFSKWGDMIFETYYASEGWDGSMNGRMVQEGVYNYYLTVKDGRGRAIDRFGNITVLNYE